MSPIGPEIPTGLDHLAMIREATAHTELDTGRHFEEHSKACELIGTAMNVLYQAATCHRKCHGGGHVLESLVGRAYNIGCSSYLLSLSGLYDEALNLIRGLGEIANLVILGAADGSKIQEWVRTDRADRLSKFGPAKVRRMLKAKGAPLCANEVWYRDLSEAYTHINPQTRPNQHDGSAFVGGRYERTGLSKCLGNLSFVLVTLALVVSKFFKLDDLYDQIRGQLSKGT